MALEAKLVKLDIVKGPELGRQAAESPNQPELGRDNVNDETEPGFLGKIEAILGFALHVAERISGREKVRI
jgi:hypothetical protein